MIRYYPTRFPSDSSHHISEAATASPSSSSSSRFGIRCGVGLVFVGEPERTEHRRDSQGRHLEVNVSKRPPQLDLTIASCSGVSNSWVSGRRAAVTSIPLPPAAASRKASPPSRVPRPAPRRQGHRRSCGGRSPPPSQRRLAPGDRMLHGQDQAQETSGPFPRPTRISPGKNPRRYHAG